MSQYIASHVVGGRFRTLAVKMVVISGLFYRSLSHPRLSYSTINWMIRHSLVWTYYVFIDHSSRSLQNPTVIFFHDSASWYRLQGPVVWSSAFFVVILQIPSGKCSHLQTQATVALLTCPRKWHLIYSLTFQADNGKRVRTNNSLDSRIYPQRKHRELIRIRRMHTSLLGTKLSIDRKQENSVTAAV